MSFHTTDRDGVTELNPPEATLRRILYSLQDDRDDNAEVWISDGASGWTLTMFSTGTMHWHNDMMDEPTRELRGIDFKKALELWLALSRGDIVGLKREKWTIIDE